MITKSELAKYAQAQKFTLAQCELDYFQHIILEALYEKFATLYFKGGTCLQKCYGIKRFSEDLDFNAKDVTLKDILKVIKTKLPPFEIIDKHETQFGVNCKIKFNAILYDGTPRTSVRISIDIRYNDVYEPGLKKIITPIYNDIQRYFVVALNEKEIFAEKIRALCTREAPRDIFDLYELIRLNITTSKELVNTKLKTYDLVFDPKFLEKRINMLEKNYDAEMSILTTIYPSFTQVKDTILKKMKIYRNTIK